MHFEHAICLAVLLQWRRRRLKSIAALLFAACLRLGHLPGWSRAGSITKYRPCLRLIEGWRNSFLSWW